ncbi:MAG TPA: hypothetical protein VK796_10650 [Cytophaga sp.]|jgi:hypothetical protein|nr:hypothetical protein [Cytophaga sp.]
MKHYLFLILLLAGFLSSTDLFAQIAEGNWYTPIRNKLLHIVISTDSIVFRKCSFDSLRDYGYADMSFKIERKVKTTYIVSSIKDTLPVYYLFSFIPDHTSNKNYMSIESFNNKFPTITDAEKSISEIEKQPLKIAFLTKKEIDTIREGKNISSMTTTDFKNYATRIIQTDSVNAQYSNKKYKLSYLYSESGAKLILAELGFNPLVKGDQFDALFDKFYQDPETQQILIKMGTKPE